MTRLLVRLLAGSSVLLQIAGLGIVAAGAWLVYPPAGVVLAGAALFATGIVIDLPRRR